MNNATTIILQDENIGKRVMDLFGKYFKRQVIKTKISEMQELSSILSDIPLELSRDVEVVLHKKKDENCYFEISSAVEREKYRDVESIENEEEFLKKIMGSRKRYNESKTKLIAIIREKLA
jgi:hypothetical protein